MHDCHLAYSIDIMCARTRWVNAGLLLERVPRVREVSARGGLCDSAAGASGARYRGEQGVALRWRMVRALDAGRRRSVQYN